MKFEQPDEKPCAESPKSVRGRIWMSTAVVVFNGLFASIDIETGFYIGAAISIFVIVLFLIDLLDLWSRPCNSSR